MTAACILVGTLILLAAGLVIYNVLKISVAKRIREYGTLRAIGSERKQLYMLVTVQLLILCGIGLPIGTLIGIVSAKGILTAATSLLNPDLFMVENTQELNSIIDKSNIESIHQYFSDTSLFAAFSAFPSTRYASCISPVTAMSRQSVDIKRRNRKQKKIHN